MLARQGLTSLSRPDETHRITLTVRFAASQRPRFVEDAMRSVLQASTRIVQDPPPDVALTSIDAVAIAAELQFRVASLAAGMSARNEIIDLVHERCGASGLALAVPAESLVCAAAGRGGVVFADRSALSRRGAGPTRTCRSRSPGRFPARVSPRDPLA